MSIIIIQVDLNKIVRDLDWDTESEIENPMHDLHGGQKIALELLLVSAREVASFSTDIAYCPGVSWHLDFTLYVARVPTLPNAFALLKLDWDDNWGRWEWSCEVAIDGAISYEEAANILLEIYRASYIGDASGSFRNFLDNLI